MTVYTPTETRSLCGGIQHRYRFDNGYGASVIRHQYSYGGDDGLWEIAVLGLDGHLTYDTPVTDDVIGRLTDAEVEVILEAIAALPVGVTP